LKPQVKISVRSLVEQVLRAGDLDLRYTGASQALEAIRLHQKIQKSRPDGYRAEVSVSHTIESNRCQITVSGRIDGIYQYPDRVVIDEIKTTARPLEDPLAENPLHWAQAKVYAFIWAADHGLKTVDVQLTYAHLDTGETREIIRALTFEQLAGSFQDLIERFSKWADAIAAWGQQRNVTLAAMGFPFEEFRPGQREMAVSVYRCLRDGGQLLIQAPTGIGKTMAALFPALKALGQKAITKLFYLTVRTTAATVAEQAVERLAKTGVQIKTLTLTAKDKICPHPKSLCTPEECPRARGHYDRIEAALCEIFATDRWTREAVSGIAEAYRVCPFEFSLDLLLWADLIIGDVNYAFDPRVYLRRLFEETSDDYGFLVDEAHNLVDRAREMFSAEITRAPVEGLRKTLGDALPELQRILEQIHRWLSTAAKTCEAAGGQMTQKEAPETLYPMLKRFVRETESWLATAAPADFREDLTQLYFTAATFLRVADSFDDTYATCTACPENDVRVKLFCIDPAPQMKEALRRCRSAVFFSATLAPAGYFRKALGCMETAGTFCLDSPFPGKHLCVAMAHRVSTLYRHRTETCMQVAALLAAMTGQHQGNYLIFLPSYAYLTQVHEAFVTLAPGTETIVQNPEMPEGDRKFFLDRFSAKNTATLAGFAVLGGIFGEGIDLVGDRLTGAAIVGVGLPGIGPERELIRQYFDDRANAGFDYAYLFPGINRVLQAAGRVIRTQNDRGTVLLVDSRYATARYRRLLPAAWKPRKAADAPEVAAIFSDFWDHGLPRLPNLR
jgi:DNA excision repair protein ERCC-2